MIQLILNMAAKQLTSLSLSVTLASCLCAPWARADSNFWSSASESEVAATKPEKIKLLVSIVWEGRDLEAHNLSALRRFRQEFPQLPLVHLLSPAYLLQDHATQNAAVIKTQQQAGDKSGLLISSWKSIVSGAGVTFKQTPTMWGPTVVDADCTPDCGADVPISAYQDDEIKKIVQFSAATLERHQFGAPQIALTSGWLASPAVLNAELAAGIRFDFSVTPPTIVAPRLSAFPLFGWIKHLWPQVTPLTQPFATKTSYGVITQIPQSLAAADYLTGDQVLAEFKELEKNLTTSPASQPLLHLSFHQETAAQFLPLLSKSLQDVITYSRARNLTIQNFDLPTPSVVREIVHMTEPPPAATETAHADGEPTQVERAAH